MLVFFTGEGLPGHTDAKADAAGVNLRGISWADQDVAVIRLDQLHRTLQRRQTVASRVLRVLSVFRVICVTNRQAIVQPRLYDCSMVTQITLVWYANRLNVLFAVVLDFAV